MSTLEQLAGTLPNGFHDAEVRSCLVDFVARRVTLEIDVWVGEVVADRDRREARQPARIILGALVFLQIEPPDPRYAFERPAAVTIDLCAPDPMHPPAKSIPSDAFLSRLFVAEWNAFIHVAARSADLAWLGQ